ncbi:NADH:ubiquinone oxidoreductase subunit C [Streptomyces sp. LBL]|uniref:NADH-quinone oxidoreductase subunit C n=1 Tax=Streptomyces sp. LBL TaxID=2940562 RepID=UPI0024755234|nr:NADH-quinone oxidoreductase subunit C [Streptomyces sp. LBL]MDH6623798.1 NADH:ubiquinone oxidoreductase subunit C [Streptomyces sp. LBL]
MTVVGWLPAPVEDLFGTEATAEESYDVLTVDVSPASWLEALETARDRLGCTYFDWLSAVDEPGAGFRVAAHVVALSPVRRLLLRTTVPHESPVLPSAVGVFAGAAWHERETHEMFGVAFEGHPALDHLLLPEGFEGHPLRKDFVLAARVAKAWPGAKEPGESGHGGPKRRQMLPPGVPDPNEWGPLKGQLPPAPARPARGAARAARERPAGTTGERPARAAGERPAAGAGERPARRARSASEGSASQQDGTGTGAGAARRARSASEGTTSRRAQTSSSEVPASRPTTAPRSSDAPWHHARTAFVEPEPGPMPAEDRPTTDRQPAAEPIRPAAEPSPAAQGSAPETAPVEEPAPAPERADAAGPVGTPEPADAAGPADVPSGEPEPQPSAEAGADADTDGRPAPAPDADTDGRPAPAPPTKTPEDPAGGPQ